MENTELTLNQRESFLKDLFEESYPELYKYLIDNKFASQPASTKFHLCYPGGLFDHSVHVTEYLISHSVAWTRPMSPYIVGMLHDICKIDLYVPQGSTYKFNVDAKDKGHGDKSVRILEKLIPDLTYEERLCIRYHMGAFTPSDQWQDYTNAIHRFENVLHTHTADMYATHVVEK